MFNKTIALSGVLGGFALLAACAPLEDIKGLSAHARRDIVPLEFDILYTRDEMLGRVPIPEVINVRRSEAASEPASDLQRRQDYIGYRTGTAVFDCPGGGRVTQSMRASMSFNFDTDLIKFGKVTNIATLKDAQYQMAPYQVLASGTNEAAAHFCISYPAKLYVCAYTWIQPFSWVAQTFSEPPSLSLEYVQAGAKLYETCLDVAPVDGQCPSAELIGRCTFVSIASSN